MHRQQICHAISERWIFLFFYKVTIAYLSTIKWEQNVRNFVTFGYTMKLRRMCCAMIVNIRILKIEKQWLMLYIY